MGVLPATRAQNALLASLRSDEWKLLEAECRHTPLVAQATLYRSHEPIEHAYFLLSGAVSLLIEFSDGFSAEAAQIGREGMVGLPLVSGRCEGNTTARVQVSGTALCVAADVLIAQLAQMPTLRQSLLRYADEQMAQSMQLTACNAHHGLEARLARCLLSLHDRTADQQIALTQESLAALLCTHRPSVSMSLQRLQRRGLVYQHKGWLNIIDRAGLEQASCECYAVVCGPAGKIEGPK